MTIEHVTGLTLSDDAVAGCKFEEDLTVRVDSDPRDIVIEDAGYAIPPQRGSSIGLTARRFSLGGADATSGGFLERHFSLLVDYATEYGLTPSDLAGCSHGRNIGFTLTFNHQRCRLVVTVTIRLTGSPVDEAKREAWRSVIRHAWSGIFKLTVISGKAPCTEYVIVVDVRWWDEGMVGTFDRSVHVSRGCGRPNVRTWYLGDDDIRVRHEFGHMLGNIDEYDGSDDGCPERPVHSGIMNDEYEWPHPFARHYYQIARHAGEMLCCAFSVEPATSHWPPHGSTFRSSLSFDRWAEGNCESFADIHFGLGSIGG
jgi:hypothetical protein